MSANIFLTKWSEVSGGRFDPSQYHFERQDAIKKLKESNRQLMILKHVASFSKTVTSDNEESLSYIGLENIEGNTGNYIKTNERETFGTALKFSTGQILFPKLRPYLNKVYFAEFNGLCSTEFHLLDSQIVMNKYLAIFLRSNLVVSQTKHLMTGNTLPRLQTEDIENLLIPILSDNEQSKIIFKMDEAYHQKEISEREANKLLQSINEYLLVELGINKQDTDNNDTSKRIYLRQWSELSGGRYDPLFHSGAVLGLFEKIAFPMKNLSSCIVQVDSGIGAGKQDQVDASNGILQIRPTNIDDNGSLKFDKNIFIPKTNTKQITQIGDVLFNNTNSQELVGKTAFIETETEMTYSNHITRIKVDLQVLDPGFLWLILNFYQKNKIFYNICTNWNNQSGVGLELLKRLPIPLPLLNKQKEISEYVKSIRTKARTLKEQAIIDFEKSKSEVEKMILGETL